MTSDIVNEVIDQRETLYGEPVQGMVRTAQIWSGILGFEVQPAQVPLMLMGYKLMRASISPDYADNSDDVEGDLDIFRKVVGEDMIHARTTADYWAQKEGPAYERKLYTEDTCKNCGEVQLKHNDDGRCRPEAHWGHTFEKAWHEIPECGE